MGNKDLERGERMVDECKLESQKRKRKACCSKTVCALSFLLFLTLSLSLLALCVSLLSYMEVKHRARNQQLLHTGETSEQLISESDVEKKVLHKLEVLMEMNEAMHFHDHSKSGANIQIRTERDSDDDTSLDAMCNSTASNESEVPLAHIVPNPSSRRGTIPYVGEAHSIITPGWICSRTSESSTDYGKVHGGMFFNRTSGFLRLPKDGFYYVYSQVIFSSGRSLTTESEIHSKLVVCIPGYKCDFPNSQSETHLESVEYIDRNQFQTLFQAGLFHFPAGTQVAIIASNLLHNGGSATRPPLDYHALWYRSYMGAFLVNAAPFNQLQE